MSVDDTEHFNQTERDNNTLTEISLAMAGLKSVEMQAKRYAEAPPGEKKTYHDKEGTHVFEVERRALMIADLLEATPTEKALIKYAALKHDYVQSEEDTAQAAVAELTNMRTKKQIPDVSTEQIQEVARGIRRTKVDFKKVSLNGKNEYLTAVQPEFDQSNSKIEIALMLADLGGIWIDGAEAQLNDAATLFLELKHYDGVPTHQIERATLVQEATAWFEDQKNFASGRLVQTLHDLNNNKYLQEKGFSKKLLLHFGLDSFLEASEVSKRKAELLKWADQKGASTETILRICKLTDLDQINALHYNAQNNSN